MSKFDKETRRNEFFTARDTELDALIDTTTGKIRADLVEKINCRLCDCPDYSVLFTKNGFDFVRCSNCTLVYINPQLKEEDVTQYYSGDLPSNDLALAFLSSERQIQVDMELHKSVYDKIMTKIPSGKILDIGSSFGLFLKTGMDLGYDVLGLELNKKAAQLAKEKFGVPVKSRLLADCQFPDNSFDVVSMFGVIEHLPKPIEVMNEVKRILKPGGMFVGRCPNVQGLVCMVLHELARTFTGRVHLSYFSPYTLRYCLCEKVGFKNLEIETFVSGKDSLLNYFQFLDPFGDEEDKFLPAKFKEFISNKDNVAWIENKMNELGLGYKLKFFAEK